MIDNPLLSIVCITYNHEKYLIQAIESFLKQQTSFPIEIILGEDCSKDKTREICIRYTERYPDIIRLETSEQNVGPQTNFLRALKSVRGKYIAYCDGDDYWTDPLKLQKQVDFLENNPDFSMCSHEVEIIYEADWNGNKKEFNRSIQIAGFEDLIDNHFIPTNSLIFRNGLIKEWPGWLFSKNMISGDIPLELMLAYHGKSYFINEKMAVKRINGGGITANSTRRERIRYFMFELYYHINNYSECKYRHIFLPKLYKILPGVLKKSLFTANIALTIKYIYYFLNAIIKK